MVFWWEFSPVLWGQISYWCTVMPDHTPPEPSRASGSGTDQCSGVASSFPGPKSNWTFVGYAPEAYFPSSKPAKTVQTVTKALREEWAAIDLGFIRRLIRSMPRRSRQCVKFRGGHTSYWAVFGPSSRILKTFLTIRTVLNLYRLNTGFRGDRGFPEVLSLCVSWLFFFFWGGGDKWMLHQCLLTNNVIINLCASSVR